MKPGESVTAWIAALKAGDESAARELWERYFPRLVGLARAVNRTAPRRAADEEDAALSAFKSFCLRAARANFPQLEDRGDLWKLLMTITARKAIHQARKEGRQPVLDGSDLLGELTGAGPSPGSVVRLGDELRHRLDHLGDETLRRIALLKLEGYTNAEIAEQFGKSLSFVERKLQLIRQTWSQDEPR